jgi:subtilisin-like proprotein convertase family protein
MLKFSNELVMKKLIFLLLFSTFFYWGSAQTFSTNSPMSIPDAGAQVCSPITVSGVGVINGAYGLAGVCINITHTWDGDLQIKLKAPDGTVIPLSIQNGSSGDNYTGTCFNMSAATSISSGVAPFSGTYVPNGNLGAANNNQNANGTWNLCIQDMSGGDIGSLSSWNITFNNTPATPPGSILPCNGLPPADNVCSNATAVCTLNGYCGNTLATYTADYWPELGTSFCGSIENNAFITFVPSSSTLNLNVYVWNSVTGYGIQMLVFSENGSCSGPVTSYACYDWMKPTGAPPAGVPISFIATGLTPGNTYYLMFDGFGGDNCNYEVIVNSGNTPTCGVLPVNLLSFTGKLIGGHSQLQWQTTAEINTSNFIIEHSLDRLIFNSIGAIQTSENSNNLKSYGFTHPTPKIGNNYYRLKTIDRDGKFSYSNIIELNMVNRQDIIIYPNPAKEFIIIEHPRSAFESQIKIMDMLGRIVLSTHTDKNSSKTKVGLKRLARGTYKVIWTDGENTTNRSLLVE